MKKLIIAVAAFVGVLTANAAVEVLDLTKASEKLEFNAETGAWTKTYEDEVTTLESQCFSFAHNAMSEYDTWWGFTASNSADNSMQSNTLKFQFSNMAKGGIVLNEDGTVKTDEKGAPVVSAEMPYIVAYYNAYMSKRPCSIVFKDGKARTPKGVYVNLTSYPYYAIELGDAYCKPFSNGDRFTLTIHGVAADETERTVDVDLATSDNGFISICRGWSYVDLSTLGAVNELYFTMTSTDTGDYGMNTPGYFCLDKLIVDDAPGAGVAAVAADAAITYDRATRTVALPAPAFSAVYDTAGSMVKSSEAAEFSIADLEAGVYIVRSGNSQIKVIR